MAELRVFVLIQLFSVWIKVGSTACTDTHADCNYWMGIHECVINPLYMMCYCAQSCNTGAECSVAAGADTDCECDFHASRGSCETSDLATTCPHTCSLRQTVTCPPHEHYPNAIAVGQRRYLDRVTYVCSYGYRNDGDVGLRVCDSSGTWRNASGTPICTYDSSLLIPCSSLVTTFEPWSVPVDKVGILDWRQDINHLECSDMCLRAPGCLYFVHDHGSRKCFLYYNVVRSGFGITETGSVWKKVFHVQPVTYYS
ncbi:uncharacterized protein LOC124290890 [Haliotis rubra]|uniref:uncharacterized protein LOC124290890 n=1 Tax=Haliotis rubra TaxID=36100 RepID=UPI001EE629C7|nr:uncharacterized protein LOC124290890 [Haliotis rubra]